MSVSEAIFKRAMSHWASGVAVVTTSNAGTLYGLTVSSFISVSLDPILVLISINRTAQSCEPIQQSGLYAVHILRDDQEDVSRRFATSSAQKFPSGSYALSSQGIPLLQGVLVTLECRLVQSIPGGDHLLFLGDVTSAQIQDGKPLLHYRSAYYRLAPSDTD